METMFWVWLAIIVVALIVEIATLELVSIWFSVGAIIPFILSAVGGIPIEIQIVVFVVVSGVMILFLRKYAQKWLFKGMNLKTNTDALVGKTYRLLEKTDFETNGSIKINDVIWKVVSENGQLIERDELVEILRVEGNKMIVRKAETQVVDEVDKQEKSAKENDEVSRENDVEINEDETLEIKVENKEEK